MEALPGCDPREVFPGVAHLRPLPHRGQDEQGVGRGPRRRITQDGLNLVPHEMLGSLELYRTPHSECELILGRRLSEGQAEPGGDQEIVALAALDRVAEKAIACSDVPAQPSLEDRAAADVEVDAAGPGVAQVGEDAHRLGDRRPLGHLVGQVVAEVGFGGCGSGGSGSFHADNRCRHRNPIECFPISPP